jgi:hypothetical protein
VRGDAGEDAKDGKRCPICDSPVPPSLGVKPRTYCSRECLRKSDGRATKPESCPCAMCGRQVLQDLRSRGRARRYCSSECRQRSKCRRKLADRSCSRCGGRFVGIKNAKFCSERCRYDPHRVTKQCLKCGHSFRRRGRTQSFCSPACARAARVGVRKPATLQCLCCQKPFRKRSSGRNSGKYCTRECAFEARRMRLPCARLTKRRGATLDEQLAVWFHSWGNDALDTVNEGMRSGGHKYRCRKYGCHYESFPLKSIFRRDGWTCQICRCELLSKWTKLGDTETPHPRSPTIDHIVPLSFGPSGPGHRPDNVQAACWRCNCKKSDSLAAPLPTQ